MSQHGLAFSFHSALFHRKPCRHGEIAVEFFLFLAMKIISRVTFCWEITVKKVS